MAPQQWARVLFALCSVVAVLAGTVVHDTHDSSGLGTCSREGLVVPLHRRAPHSASLHAVKASMAAASSPHALARSANAGGDSVASHSTLSLFGSIQVTHEYYTSLQVGGQPFTVQVDTGSVGLYIPGEHCHQADTFSSREGHGTCDHSNPLYRPEASDKMQYTPCDADLCRHCHRSLCYFEMHYADGSFLEGPLITDTVEVGSFSFPMRVGVMHKENKQFAATSIDGILGMAYPALDEYNGEALMDALTSEYPSVDDVFSLCVSDGGGSFTLGRMAHASESNFLWVPLEKPYEFFRVRMTGIYVRGEEQPQGSDRPRSAASSANKLSIASSAATIVDSGTTLLLMPKEDLKELQRIFSKVAPSAPYISSKHSLFDPDGCFPLDRHTLDTLYPTLSFEFGDVEAALKPSTYLIPALNLLGQECFFLGFQVNSQPHYVLGDTFLRGFNAVFDRTRHRFGFGALSTCPVHPKPYNAALLGTGCSRVSTGEPCTIHVEVLYEDKEPVVGVIVEFATDEHGDEYLTNLKDKVLGRATNSSGIAEITVTFIKSGHLRLMAYAVGSASEPLFIPMTAIGYSFELAPSETFIFSSSDGRPITESGVLLLKLAVLIIVGMGLLVVALLAKTAYELYKNSNRSLGDEESQRGVRLLSDIGQVDGEEEEEGGGFGSGVALNNVVEFHVGGDGENEDEDDEGDDALWDLAVRRHQAEGHIVATGDATMSTGEQFDTQLKSSKDDEHAADEEGEGGFGSDAIDGEADESGMTDGSEGE